MTFAAGDVVFLKSGGEAMTVVAIEDNEAMCLWIGDEGDLFRETIPVVALQTAQSAEEDEDGEEEDSEEEDESEEDEENDEEENAKSKKKKEIA
ncbi:MAG TPA: DUF2158 domain-containing protein [Pseudolabrys sp.]